MVVVVCVCVCACVVVVVVVVVVYVGGGGGEGRRGGRYLHRLELYAKASLRNRHWPHRGSDRLRKGAFAHVLHPGVVHALDVICASAKRSVRVSGGLGIIQEGALALRQCHHLSRATDHSQKPSLLKSRLSVVVVASLHLELGLQRGSHGVTS